MPERVIELDGLTEFLVRYRAESGVLVFDPATGVPGRVLLSDCTGHCGSMLLEPDPVRAAELAAVERCRKSATDAVAGVLPAGVMLDQCRAAILASIDEPDETVSEYKRGAEDLRLRAAREATAQACYEVAAAIKALPLTEPPR